MRRNLIVARKANNPVYAFFYVVWRPFDELPGLVRVALTAGAVILLTVAESAAQGSLPTAAVWLAALLFVHRLGWILLQPIFRLLVRPE